MVIVAGCRLEGVVTKNSGDGQYVLRIIGGESRGCTIAEEMRVDGPSKEVFGQTAGVTIDGLFTHGCAAGRDPEMREGVSVYQYWPVNTEIGLQIGNETGLEIEVEGEVILHLVGLVVTAPAIAILD